MVDGKIEGNLNFLLPMRVRFQPDALTSGAIAKQVHSLATKFLNSPERASPGRGHRALKDPSGDEARNMIHGLFPDGFLIGNQEVKPDMPIAKDIKPAAFVIATERKSVAQEGGHISTMRVCVLGFRSIWCVRTKEIHRWMAAKAKK